MLDDLKNDDWSEKINIKSGKRKKPKKKKFLEIHDHFPIRSQSLGNKEKFSNKSCISNILLDRNKKKNIKKKNKRDDVNLETIINVNNIVSQIVDGYISDVEARELILEVKN